MGGTKRKAPLRWPGPSGALRSRTGSERKSAAAISAARCWRPRALERCPCGMETAFVATWGGEGHRFFGDDADALPALSQQAGCAEKAPLMVASWLRAQPAGRGQLCRSRGAEGLPPRNRPARHRQHGLPGRGGRRRGAFARAGYFDKVDANAWCPRLMNYVSAAGAALAVTGVPPWRDARPTCGRALRPGAALDAAELMNGRKLSAGTHHPRGVSCITLIATWAAPPPTWCRRAPACITTSVRAPVAQMLTRRRVDDVAWGAALMDGHGAHHPRGGFSGLCAQIGAVRAVARMREVGAPAWDEADRALAAPVRRHAAGERGQPGLHAPAMDLPLPLCVATDDGIAPFFPLQNRRASAALTGDVSYCAPTAQCYYAAGQGTAATPADGRRKSCSPLGFKGHAGGGSHGAGGRARGAADPALLASGQERSSAAARRLHTAPCRKTPSPHMWNRPRLGRRGGKREGTPLGARARRPHLRKPCPPARALRPAAKHARKASKMRSLVLFAPCCCIINAKAPGAAGQRPQKKWGLTGCRGAFRIVRQPDGDPRQDRSSGINFNLPRPSAPSFVLVMALGHGGTITAGRHEGHRRQKPCGSSCSRPCHRQAGCYYKAPQVGRWQNVTIDKFSLIPTFLSGRAFPGGKAHACCCYAHHRRHARCGAVTTPISEAQMERILTA